MKRIPRTQTTFLFGPDQRPVAEIAPGETVLFETQDAHAGQVQTQADALSFVAPFTQVNPATGPVYVLGAQPGDTLAVRIVDIRLGPVGHARVRPGRGVLGAELRAPAAHMMPVRDGIIVFDENIRFPARPNVGVIGTAPAGDSVPSYYAGPHGGNLDINAVCTGTTVYLPVAVPGALLAIGDVHASMGDGELPGSAIEIPAEVIVQVDLYHNLGWERPLLETAIGWCTCGNGPDLADAIRLATDDMTRLLSERLDLSFEESFMLIGAAGDARIGQAARLGVGETAYVCIAKTILPEALVGRQGQLHLGVIWDLDGVLVDSTELHYRSWSHVLPEFGISFTPELFQTTFGMNNTGVLTAFLGYTPERKLVLEVSKRKEEWFREAARGNVQPLPGVRLWLERLRAAGFQQAIASSAPQANIDTLVDELGLRSYFEALVSGFDLPGKPDPATFLKAAQAIGVPPERCVVVEDATAGVQGARRAGMKCIAVTTTNRPEALQGADLIVERLDLLPQDIFDRLLP